MSKVRVILIAIWVVLVCQAGRTSAQTLDDTGLWFAAFGNGEMKTLAGNDSRLRWWFDTHYRLRDDTSGFNQSIVRPGLGLTITDDQALWAGYAWIRTSPIQGNDFDEHRFWQQWTAAPSAGDFRFLHRSRFEQRWLETGEDVGLRWRQLHRVQRILSDSPQWSLIVWDEIFFNLNDTDWGARAGLDQNRAFFGVGYQRCSQAPVRTEIGYLNQFVNNQGGTDGMNHILSINFYF
ncbi:DUF2490 domain-containing protein [Allorhodopirellula heiligendammensis]|uniref:DUF2490 domain-containing protein n=1 Tax=Allorhodopirellula heiligendammensis TaxID=2714739 RepID=A0A5C6BX24_9BACT|nr:DUF2490 domain-containing protein [Allorhodopirellula heiligendammensis]TWU16418.1 hypothetical protein Poly21_36230 [Allorhodopirellula heiligendammensis]|tara:strand:- start:222 stop:926 length:705 start_codon:yes stop_codon:yes gene_type:complete